MSIQQTVNQSLAVGAALATQNPMVQEKMTEKKYKILGKAADKLSVKVTNMRDEDVKPEDYDKIAHYLDRQNALIPSEDLVGDAELWRENAQNARLKRIEARNKDKQEEALNYVVDQKEAAILQKQRIEETMKV